MDLYPLLNSAYLTLAIQISERADLSTSAQQKANTTTAQSVASWSTKEWTANWHKIKLQHAVSEARHKHFVREQKCFYVSCVVALGQLYKLSIRNRRKHFSVQRSVKGTKKLMGGQRKSWSKRNQNSLSSRVESIICVIHLWVSTQCLRNTGLFVQLINIKVERWLCYIHQDTLEVLEWQQNDA